MKCILVILILMPFAVAAQQQKALSLSKAYEMAYLNYPLVRQKDLIRQTEGININNLNKNFLPQFSLNGQATYQSDVIEFKMPVPGLTIIPPSKDQYKVQADLNQLVFDGGTIRQQKNIQKWNEETEQQKVEVELYKLKERVNQLFLGVLFFDEQLKQVELIRSDLNIGISKTTAQVNNGVAFRSNLSLLQAELLKTEQRVIEIKASRKGFTDVLGLFIDQSLPEDIVLEKPGTSPENFSTEIFRPELKLFSTQQKLLQGQYKLIDARNTPKASLFFQGGYGRPGLDFLKNEFSFFYTTGLRVNWSLGGLYTQKKEKQLIGLNKKSVEIQKETFLLNAAMALKQQQAEVDKLEKLILKDKEIIDLRIKVKDAAKAQLENGVITANDYLREVNAEDQSRQSLITHQVQLLQAKINYLTISGKQ